MNDFDKEVKWGAEKFSPFTAERSAFVFGANFARDLFEIELSKFLKAKEPLCLTCNYPHPGHFEHCKTSSANLE